MRKKIVVIAGLIIGLSIITLSIIQSTSNINEDAIIIDNKNLEIFYFNNLDPENPYNKDFSNLSDKQIKINAKLLEFASKRITRSYGKIFEFIYKIDEISLKKKKSIDQKTIKEALG